MIPKNIVSKLCNINDKMTMKWYDNVFLQAGKRDKPADLCGRDGS